MTHDFIEVIDISHNAMQEIAKNVNNFILHVNELAEFLNRESMDCVYGSFHCEWKYFKDNWEINND